MKEIACVFLVLSTAGFSAEDKEFFKEGAVGSENPASQGDGLVENNAAAAAGSESNENQKRAEHLCGAEESKAEPSSSPRFDPVGKDIAGWTVHVDPALLKGPHSKEGKRELAMLANHLQRIAILLASDRLRRMQKLEIWIEYHHPKLGAMQYHPSRRWLVEHGYDPRLAGKVHIPRAKALLSRHQMFKHPMVVLHELAHAYHAKFLGFDHPGIIKAYKRAKASGTYDKVLLYNGKKVRHYGMTNHKEYFAEGTESYFYRNDFYPFVRAELKEHDPEFHDLLVKIWGPPG